MNLESRNTLKLGSSNGTRWLQVQFIAISLVLGLQFSRFFGAAAQRGPWPPHSWGSCITHNDAPQSVGRVIRSTHRPLPDNTQHSQQTDIHAAGGIRTCNPSERTAAELRLRPCGHWDRQLSWKLTVIFWASTVQHVHKYTKTELFCIITQRVVIISHRRFGTTYRVPYSRVKNPKKLDSWLLNMGTKGCPETSVRNYHYWLRNNAEVRNSHLVRGGILNTFRTGLLNCLNARSRGLTFRHRASCI